MHARRVGVAAVMHGVWPHIRTVEIPGQSGPKQSSGTKVRNPGQLATMLHDKFKIVQWFWKPMACLFLCLNNHWNALLEGI